MIVELSDHERRLILKWADRAWQDADKERMAADPESRWTVERLEDQTDIETIAGKLRI